MHETSALDVILKRQLEATPQYGDALARRLDGSEPSELAFLEHLSDLVLKLTGEDLPQFCRDYQWICELVLAEEMHFRRHGTYRLSRFDDALEEVYSRPEVMQPYMNGLLMTQLWWPNHTRANSFLVERFLPACPDGYRLLEVGPGHGLLMYFPVLDDRCAHVEGWDISETSLESTRQSLARLGSTREVVLRCRNLFDSADFSKRFDAIVFSEVLEHLDKPAEALQRLRDTLKPGGRIYIHMPINAPAPDHLFNLDTPNEVASFVEAQGLEVVDSEAVPMMGYTLDKARKMRLTISCLIVARR